MKHYRIGVVTSLFNPEITLLLEEAALETLVHQGLPRENVHGLRVPGAFEIPLAVKALFETQKCDGVIALGAVIRGDTSHYDYVCSAVERGCSQLALQFGKPVGFGVLTTENEKQALERAGGSMGNKGSETAKVVLDMCDLLSSLRSGV